MTLMPDFQRDLEHASGRWKRPLPKALRAGRRLAAPLAVAGAIVVAIAAWPQPREREAAPIATEAPPKLDNPPQDRRPQIQGGNLEGLIGDDGVVGPLPEAARDAIAGQWSRRLAVDAAYAFAAPPGEAVPVSAAPATAEEEQWYLVEGDGEYCAILERTAICDPTTDATDALRRGRISVYATNPSGRSQLLGIVEDGVRAVRVEDADGVANAETTVHGNTYRLELPDRFREADGPTPHPVFVYEDRSTGAS